MKRTNHKWQPFQNSELEQCGDCGLFRKRIAYVKGGLGIIQSGRWKFKYSKEGSSVWLDAAPICDVEISHTHPYMKASNWIPDNNGNFYFKFLFDKPNLTESHRQRLLELQRMAINSQKNKMHRHNPR